MEDLMTADRSTLLQQLDETRAKLEALLPGIDARKEIYPGWTIKDLLAHVTGWDDATIESLRAHVAGRPPATPADRGIDEYNGRTVTTRKDLDHTHVLNEFHLTRQVMRTLIDQMPEEKFIQPLIFAWGQKGTVTDLVEIFREHEEEHSRDIRTWLKNPDQPLEKAGN
jgi:hypothetical protein